MVVWSKEFPQNFMTEDAVLTLLSAKAIIVDHIE